MTAYESMTLNQLHHALANHEAIRPVNLQVDELRTRALKKERITYWLTVRTAEDRSRWRPVYIAEKAINVPQPPPEDAEQGLEDRLADLRATSSMGFNLDGVSQKKHAQRCATMRHGIREYCIRHGLAIPAAVRVVSPRDRHAAELSEVVL